MIPTPSLVAASSNADINALQTSLDQISARVSGNSVNLHRVGHRVSFCEKVTCFAIAALGYLVGKTSAAPSVRHIPHHYNEMSFHIGAPIGSCARVPGGLQCSFLTDAGSIARITYDNEGLSDIGFRKNPPSEEVTRALSGEEGVCRRLTTQQCAHHYQILDDSRNMRRGAVFGTFFVPDHFKCEQPYEMHFAACDIAVSQATQAVLPESEFNYVKQRGSDRATITIPLDSIGSVENAMTISEKSP